MTSSQNPRPKRDLGLPILLIILGLLIVSLGAGYLFYVQPSQTAQRVIPTATVQMAIPTPTFTPPPVESPLPTVGATPTATPTAIPIPTPTPLPTPVSKDSGDLPQWNGNANQFIAETLALVLDSTKATLTAKGQKDLADSLSLAPIRELTEFETAACDNSLLNASNVIVTYCRVPGEKPAFLFFAKNVERYAKQALPNAHLVILTAFGDYLVTRAKGATTSSLNERECGAGWSVYSLVLQGRTNKIYRDAMNRYAGPAFWPGYASTPTPDKCAA